MRLASTTIRMLRLVVSLEIALLVPCGSLGSDSLLVHLLSSSRAICTNHRNLFLFISHMMSLRLLRRQSSSLLIWSKSDIPSIPLFTNRLVTASIEIRMLLFFRSCPDFASAEYRGRTTVLQRLTRSVSFASELKCRRFTLLYFALPLQFIAHLMAHLDCLKRIVSPLRLPRLDLPDSRAPFSDCKCLVSFFFSSF